MVPYILKFRIFESIHNLCFSSNLDMFDAFFLWNDFFYHLWFFKLNLIAV